jgi:hypothetical protein
MNGPKHIFIEVLIDGQHPAHRTVTITGTAAEDQVLMAVSTLADVDVLGTLHYQWQHDVGSGFNNVGADQSTYTLGNSDIGGTVRVVSCIPTPVARWRA